MTERPTLFADIDGVFARVIHDDLQAPASRRLYPEAIERLNQIVGATCCRVVVSSTWRESMSPSDLWRAFSRVGYRHQIDDVTPQLVAKYRGVEIESWLTRHRLAYVPFAILDDDAPIIGHMRHRLVHVTGGQIVDSDVDRAIAMLHRPVERCALDDDRVAS
jgi:hypothetical protein